MIYIYTLIRTGFHQNPIPSGNFVTSKVSFADFQKIIRYICDVKLYIITKDYYAKGRLQTELNPDQYFMAYINNSAPAMLNSNSSNPYVVLL